MSKFSILTDRLLKTLKPLRYTSCLGDVYYHMGKIQKTMEMYNSAQNIYSDLNLGEQVKVIKKN